MSKILLLNPNFTGIYGKFSSIAKDSVLWPPMGLAYLAGNIQGAHIVKIQDLELDPDIHTTLKTFNPDYVGITFSTPLYEQALDLFRIVKEHNPRIWTIAGGPHPTTLPETVIGKNVDTVIVGEGEIAINKFLDNPQKGIMAREPLITDLDTIKFPARELLDNDKYKFAVPGKGIVPLTSFMTSRGCPFMCSFCSAHLMFGRQMRYRSVDSCIEELHIIKDKFKITHLSMLDDTLGLDKNRTYELCDRMVEEKLDMTFEGYTRVNVITKELLQKLKAAGLNRLSFGVESGNQEILDAIHKGTNLDQIRKAYQLADEAGIETRMSIIFGLPGETKQTIDKTIKFMNSLKCKQAYINVLVPFPGTEVYDDAKTGKGGLKLLTEDWTQYKRWGSKAVVSVNDLTPEDLATLRDKAMLKFHMRPDRMLYNIRRAGFKACVQNGLHFAKSFINKK